MTDLAPESTAAFSLRALHPLFGAEITGLALPAATPADIEDLRAAIGRYGLLLFRDVPFDDAALDRFAAAFGPQQNLSPRDGPPMTLARISNLDSKGQMLPPDHQRRANNDANELWHTDSTYLTPGASFSLLHARTIPAEGGDTEYLDARVAWDALSPERQGQLRPLYADHSIRQSRKLIGFIIPDSSTGATNPSVRRPLVRRHAPSGREALRIASHIERIDGMTYEEARALVEELTAVASAPGRVYRHQWRLGDLLMWDNRCMMHRATPYPQFDQPRDMRSTRVIDPDCDGVPVGA